MLDALRRLLSPEYLVVAEPGPLGNLWPLYVALGLLFAVGFCVALWILAGPRRRLQAAGHRTWAWFEFWVCLAGLGAVVGRFLSWPGWSARIWPYSLALLAVSGALVYATRHLPLPASLRTQLDILAFNLPSRTKEGGTASPLSTPREAGISGPVLLVVLHLLGLGLILTGRYGWPLWTAPLVLLALLLPQSPLLWRNRRWPVLLALSPLAGAYLATGLWLLYQALDLTVVPWQGLAFPNPMVSLFYVDGIVLAAAAHTTLSGFYVTSYLLDRPRAFWQMTVAALLTVTLLWAGVVYFGKRTQGATASDPYAYAQMGVDLAERGTFLHRYSLFQDVIPLGIAWAPLQPVGYHIPRNDLGDCPSVWATGASVLLAMGYKLFGETGLYITTPIVALLAVASTWLLTQETLRTEPRALRYVVGTLVASLVATSPEFVDRLLVPMADAPAQFFTVLMLLCVLRGMRQLGAGRSSWPLFLLAGIFFAWAYWVRHTQLVLALPAVLALVLGLGEQNRKPDAIRSISWTAAITPFLVFGAAAFVAAMPDIVYRWRVFGSPLATETTELPLMSLEHIGPVAVQMLRDALVAGEWGYLLPFALYGTYHLARRHPRPALVLGSAFFAVLLVHLTYYSLRLRDLISLFPLVNLVVAYGAVLLVDRARKLVRNQTAHLGAALMPVAVIVWVILGLALSRWAMIDNLWRPGWASFGYMRPEHRAAFDRLAELTPPEAVVGASLNAGAVSLYAARDPIRPYDSWTEDEWAAFLETMQQQNRPVYLLDDGGLMADFIQAEQARRTLRPIAELEMPLFYTRDRMTGWLYHLEWGP